MYQLSWPTSCPKSRKENFRNNTRREVRTRSLLNAVVSVSPPAIHYASKEGSGVMSCFRQSRDAVFSPSTRAPWKVRNRLSIGVIIVVGGIMLVRLSAEKQQENLEKRWFWDYENCTVFTTSPKPWNLRQKAGRGIERATVGIIVTLFSSHLLQHYAKFFTTGAFVSSLRSE